MGRLLKEIGYVDGETVPTAGEFIFGTAGLGRCNQASAVYKGFANALDLGIREFDTAPIYIQGMAERLLGNFLKGAPLGKVKITTKVGFLPRFPTPMTAGPVFFCQKLLGGVAGKALGLRRFNTEDVRGSIDSAERSLVRSLRRLRVEQVDTLMAHELPGDFLATDEFQEWIDKGLVRGHFRRWGVGGYCHQYLGVAQAELGGKRCEVVQVEVPERAQSDWSSRIEYRLHGVLPLVNGLRDRRALPKRARFVICSRERARLSSLMTALVDDS